MSDKADLFEILEKVDMFDVEYLDSLPDESKKGVSNYMLLRWMSCSDDATKIHRLAGTPNKVMFSLGHNHSMLVMHLLSSCGLGKKDNYKWKKKNVSKGNRPLTVELLQQYYKTSKDDAIKDSILMNLESMEEIAEDLGRADCIKKLRKEFNA